MNARIDVLAISSINWVLLPLGVLRGESAPAAISTASALAAFRALQTARILLQDVLSILPFEAVTRELSALADVLIKTIGTTQDYLAEQIMPPGWAG